MGEARNGNIIISDLIGVPFKRHGRSKETGFDCFGLVIEVFKRYGIMLPDYVDANVDACDCKTVSEVIRRHIGDWERLIEPVEPCLVTIRNNPIYVGHLGAYIGNNYFINTLKKMGTCLIPINHPYWSKKINGFYRPK